MRRIDAHHAMRVGHVLEHRLGEAAREGEPRRALAGEPLEAELRDGEPPRALQQGEVGAGDGKGR